jgi:hypothetical protein
MSLTQLREFKRPAHTIRNLKNAMRLEDRRRLESGEVSVEQLSREVSIVDPKNARAGRIQFSIHGTVCADAR